PGSFVAQVASRKFGQTSPSHDGHTEISRIPHSELLKTHDRQSKRGDGQKSEHQLDHVSLYSKHPCHACPRVSLASQRETHDTNRVSLSVFEQRLPPVRAPLRAKRRCSSSLSD